VPFSSPPPRALPLPTTPCAALGAQGIKSGVGNSSLLYDEFIVYDPAQFVQKYVLQVKFKFGNFY